MSGGVTVSPQAASRKGVTRLIAGYAAIAFILPYLALKIAWISGVPAGMLDKGLVADPRMIAVNILTFCMDAVAILLALAFTHGWGLRVPAGPLLFPMWVGTGFLAPIVVAVPLITLVRLLGLDPGERPARGASTAAQALVEPWARAVVFTPIASIDSGRGPTNTIPAFSTARAKSAFSERNPYPGWIASARVRRAASRTRPASR